MRGVRAETQAGIEAATMKKYINLEFRLCTPLPCLLSSLGGPSALFCSAQLWILRGAQASCLNSSACIAGTRFSPNIATGAL